MTTQANFPEPEVWQAEDRRHHGAERTYDAIVSAAKEQGRIEAAERIVAWVQAQIGTLAEPQRLLALTLAEEVRRG